MSNLNAEYLTVPMPWKKIDVPGSVYEINREGDIRTAAILSPNGFNVLVPPISIPQFPDRRTGEPYISVRHRGFQVVRQTKRLLAEAFVPNPDDLPFVKILDGNPENLVPENLQWTAESKPRPKGENSKVSKLTRADVTEIRARLESGESGVSIAERYGVHSSLISHIKKGTKWK